MVGKVISFYDQFKCLAGECPYTCCGEWGIAIDDETYAAYRKVGGHLGRKLRFYTYQSRVNGPVIRKIHDRCPFHTKEGLCGLQTAQHEQLMPYVCRWYPRRSVSYGQNYEVTLELSCIQAAKLFLQQKEPVKWEEAKEQIPITIPYRHAYEEMLAFLMDDRQKLLSYLSQKEYAWSSSYPEKLRAVYENVYLKQQYLAKEDFTAAYGLHLPLTGEEKKAYTIPSIRTGYAFYSLSFFNHFIYERFSYTCTAKRNAFLYQIMEQYKSIFGHYDQQQAEEFFEQNMRRMLSRYPELEQEYLSYFSYLLLQTYCQAYEDCYLIGPILSAAFAVEFVMLLELVVFLQGEELNLEKRAAVLANTEKAIRHSTSLKKELLQRVRKEGEKL